LFNPVVDGIDAFQVDTITVRSYANFDDHGGLWRFSASPENG
jgi:hypothetical protein